MLLFDLHHEVRFTPVAPDDLREEGHVRTALPEFIPRDPGDLKRDPENPLQTRVVDHHGLEVFGPADVELDSPDPGGDRRVESRQGVFERPTVVVLAPVGDDPAVFQALGIRA